MIYYQNNKLHDESITQSLSSPAFRYGSGFFETLLYNGQKICHLSQHIQRLHSSLAFYDFESIPIDYQYCIEQVLMANSLEKQPARINILCLLEESGPCSPIVTAVPYQPEPEKRYRLCLASEAIQAPLLKHKSMNYMFHWLERRRATGLGYDDAVFFTPDGYIAEATCAALIFSDGTAFYTPDGGHRLPSSTVRTAANLLTVHSRTIEAASLHQFTHAYVLNSLIGMRPVCELAGTTFTIDEEICPRVTAAICG